MFGASGVGITDTLTGFIEKGTLRGEGYVGSVKKDNANLSSFGSDEDAQQLVSTWITKGKHDKLLECWVKGLSVDWNQLYGDAKPTRISLPTYPFAKERYWPEAAAADTVKPAPANAGQLHPLLHQNTSTAFESTFTSHFTGAEFFFADHQVQGQKVFPGVGHLEMARVAISKALASDAVIEVSDVVWLRPLMITDEPLSVHISVIPTSDTAVEYDIYRVDAEGEEVLYSQGRGRLVENAEPPVIDLSQLQTLCTRQPLSREAVYAAFDNVGLHYGAGHQGIKALHVGEDDYQRPQVLATLSMPTTAGEFGLHPGLLDSALQASIGLAVEQEAVDGTPLPFARPPSPFIAPYLRLLTPGCVTVKEVALGIRCRSSTSLCVMNRAGSVRHSRALAQDC